MEASGAENTKRTKGVESTKSIQGSEAAKNVEAETVPVESSSVSSVSDSLTQAKPQARPGGQIISRTPGGLRVFSTSAEQTRLIGQALGGLLQAGDLIILDGSLGAGKTTFVQGVARALDVRGRVTSPTFIVARAHRANAGGPGLVHVDAYRLSDADDLESVDLLDSLADSVTFVEWGRGKVEGLSEQRLEIEFASGVAPEGRVGVEPEYTSEHASEHAFGCASNHTSDSAPGADYAFDAVSNSASNFAVNYTLDHESESDCTSDPASEHASICTSSYASGRTNESVNGHTSEDADEGTDEGEPRWLTFVPVGEVWVQRVEQLAQLLEGCFA